MRAVLVAALAVAALGCKHRGRATPDDAPRPIADDAARPAARDAGIDATAAGAWPELADLPRATARRVIALPARPDQPRFDVSGPVIVGDVAIVASSQFGFVAVDWRHGVVAWAKPTGLRVAPPLAHGGGAVLIAACLGAPEVPAGEALLGCVRVVTATGGDQGYLAIHGQGLTTFLGAAGTQDVWARGEREVGWRRGEAAVAVDLLTGVARALLGGPPPLAVTYRGGRWDYAIEDDVIVARQAGREAWRSRGRANALLGAVYLADQTPMLRFARIGAFGGVPEVNVLDIDATGSMHGQAAFPVPGIGLLGFGTSPEGDVAIAVRLDRSIQRDFIAAYASTAQRMWVYPLPEVPRADLIGVAIAPDAVVVFHDGDTVTVLPELSPPPTAPGAPSGAWRNPTP
jgi:hypothetical protein